MPNTGGRWFSFVIASGALVPWLLVPGCSDDEEAKAPRKDAGRDAATGGTGGSGGGTGGTGGGTGGSTGGSGGSTGGSGGTDAGGDVESDASDTGVSCVGDDVDATPPTIVSAAMISGDEIRITFSEPVQPPDQVDPTKFRLSIAYRYNAEGSISTRYEDLSVGTVDGVVPFDELSGQCTAEVAAVLASNVGISAVCQRIAELAEDSIKTQIGLYLHFTEEGSPTIEDRSGNPLAGIAEDWFRLEDGGLIMTDSVSSTDDSRPPEFPNAPVRVSVDCGGDSGAD